MLFYQLDEAERARILKLTRDSYETGITEGRDRERCDSGRRRPPPEKLPERVETLWEGPDEDLNARTREMIDDHVHEQVHHHMYAPEAFTPVIKPRYTELMPTDQWLNAHKMLAFYVTNKEAEEFRVKCDEAGISQSDALREVLTATLEGGKRKRG